MEGWIKLHRAITESAVFDDPEALKLWIWFLCNAVYETHDVLYLGNVISLKAGQIITGRKKIALQTGMSENKVYRAINILKSLGNISVESNNKYSIITINNWLKYQSETQKITIGIMPMQQQTQQQNNSKLNNKTTAKQQQTQHNIRNKEYKEREEIKNNSESALSGELPEIDFGFKDRGF